ncbi:SUF system NifU family Fe-S cluster assembly protein [Candidatus Woesearchaeota archaeon]|nr:SUF system NifU family Fe-S cluster assembly protein [Candidatus Woesearchaeota archaeon]
MNSDMYKDYIVELYSNPLNFGILKNANYVKSGHNISCGDKITLQLFVDNGIVKDAKFEGSGCAIHMASSSLLTNKIIGMQVNKVKKITSQDTIDELHIDISPTRIKCAILVWDTLHEMLNNEEEKC